MSGDLSPDVQADLNNFIQAAQQQKSIQDAIHKLTDVCWERCVKDPESKLSSRDSTCLSQCAERYLDTSMFVLQRLSQQKMT